MCSSPAFSVVHRDGHTIHARTPPLLPRTISTLKIAPPPPSHGISSVNTVKQRARLPPTANFHGNRYESGRIVWIAFGVPF